MGDPTPPTVSDLGALLAGFRRSSTAAISDNLGRLPGAIGIRPVHPVNEVMVGRALTVRVPAGDNRAIHQALELVKPGDVIVVDGEGDLGRALVGEIIMAIAQARGAAGFVVDGAIRDSKAFAAAGFPCFARGVIHRGPFKNEPGQINVKVSVGGLVVAPGDIVVGDQDGVVAFPQSVAAGLLAAVREQETREEEILRSIRAGTNLGAYSAYSVRP
jgi:regulator of RNase E activity RraA